MRSEDYTPTTCAEAPTRHAQEVKRVLRRENERLAERVEKLEAALGKWSDDFERRTGLTTRGANRESRLGRDDIAQIWDETRELLKSEGRSPDMRPPATERDTRDAARPSPYMSNCRCGQAMPHIRGPKCLAEARP
jgi:hypothetical protein